MSNLKEHALQEFKALGYKPIEECEDGPNKWIQENVLELLEVFSKQGHSGSSASYCLAMFEKLAKFECLGPLTGEEFEWNQVSDDLYQNSRCFHVFRDKDITYDSEAIIFRETDDESCFLNVNSRVPVTFPYTPKRVYVETNKHHDRVKIDDMWVDIDEGLKIIIQKEFK